MSSNIKVQRICQYCSKVFTARTTSTMYCSPKCNKADYKAKIKAAKIETSDAETLRAISIPIEELKAKDFLTITETCILLSISRWTVWRLIKRGELKAGKIGRRILIKRSELNKLVDTSTPTAAIHKKEKKPEILGLDDCYKLIEVREKYKISDRALHDIIKRNGIPKLKKGIHSYVPKESIDNLFK